MNREAIAAGALVALIWSSCGADDLPRITVQPYPAHQVGQSASVRAGLVVIGEDSWASLTVGGGFTLTCSVQTVTAENSSYSAFLAGYNAAIAHVPPIQPADYNVGGFSSLQAGRCRPCSFQYRGRMLEGQATINATSHGAGFVFSIGGVEMTKDDTRTFDICKPSAPGGNAGCTP